MPVIRIAASALVISFLYVVFRRIRRFIAGGQCDCHPDLSGRVFVVTGATGGLGFETVRRLAKLHATLVFLDRDRSKAADTARLLRSEYQNEAIETVHCDLADLMSVDKAASYVISRYKVIDVLINNAGVCYPPLSETRQGFELQYGVNHLAHFALTAKLLPALIAGKGRVVAVASRRHWSPPSAGGVCFEWGLRYDSLRAREAQKKSGYVASRWYGQSKLCNILFARELQRRYGSQGVSAFALHPGVIFTGAGRHLVGGIAQIVRRYVQAIADLFLKNAEQGAQTQLHCALAPLEDLIPGEYYRDCTVAPSSELSRDQGLAKKLWEVSEDQLEKYMH